MQILKTTKTFAKVGWLGLLLTVLAGSASAQSTDIAWPTPVRTNEVSGTIPARDLGDPRVTDHFYAFIGTPGDVLISVDSQNLNGDIDVFTLSGLRPLLKFTVYAGSSSAITKSIYLRQSEELLLRVEGRTPNDDNAVYRLRFGGSFQSITSGPLVEHDDAAQSAKTGGSGDHKGRRVSSVGARIDEPPSEVATVPTPEPSPEKPSTSEPKATTKPPARSGRSRRPAPRKTATTKTAKPKETAKAETEKQPPAETTTETPAPVPRPPRRGRAARAAAKPPAAQEPENTGPRLVIETNDGTLVDRYMSSVRRVTIENGQVVVVGKDGKIQRISLANVVRMTITP